MSTYSVAQVEAFTGISAHSLRIWERRYDFIIPQRTATNIRFYSDIQLKKLINVGILTRNRYKISKIVAMTDVEVHRHVSDIILQPSAVHEEGIHSLTLSMIDLDEEQFNHTYHSYIRRHGILNTFTHLIYPFLRHVGVLWGIDKTMPAQEHFISNLIRQKLIASIDAFPTASKNAPVLLLFLLKGEEHDIGLLLAHFIARELGWKTYYLGRNVPIEDIKQVVESTHPELLFSMFVSTRKTKFRAMQEELMQNIHVPLLYSGNPYTNSTISEGKSIFVESPLALINFLKNHKK